MIVKLHNWNLTQPEAVRTQTEFRDRIILEWDECRMEQFAEQT